MVDTKPDGGQSPSPSSQCTGSNSWSVTPYSRSPSEYIGGGPVLKICYKCKKRKGRKRFKKHAWLAFQDCNRLCNACSNKRCSECGKSGQFPDLFDSIEYDKEFGRRCKWCKVEGAGLLLLPPSRPSPEPASPALPVATRAMIDGWEMPLDPEPGPAPPDSPEVSTVSPKASVKSYEQHLFQSFVSFGSSARRQSPPRSQNDMASKGWNKEEWKRGDGNRNKDWSSTHSSRRSRSPRGRSRSPSPTKRRRRHESASQHWRSISRSPSRSCSPTRRRSISPRRKSRSPSPARTDLLWKQSPLGQRRSGSRPRSKSRVKASPPASESKKLQSWNHSSTLSHGPPSPPLSPKQQQQQPLPLKPQPLPSSMTYLSPSPNSSAPLSPAPPHPRLQLSKNSDPTPNASRERCAYGAQQSQNWPRVLITQPKSDTQEQQDSLTGGQYDANPHGTTNAGVAPSPSKMLSQNTNWMKKKSNDAPAAVSQFPPVLTPTNVKKESSSETVGYNHPLSRHVPPVNYGDVISDSQSQLLPHARPGSQSSPRSFKPSSRSQSSLVSRKSSPSTMPLPISTTSNATVPTARLLPKGSYRLFIRDSDGGFSEHTLMRMFSRYNIKKVEIRHVSRPLVVSNVV